MVEAGDSMGAMFVKSHVMTEIVESGGM